MSMVPETAVAIRLARINRKGELILCEAVHFVEGRSAVDTTLRRARLAGHVEIGGEIENHFADLLDENGDLQGTVALDAKSYSALKNHWMRCKVEH